MRQLAARNRWSMGTSKPGIYAIRNTVTGERYVGQAVDIPGHWLAHRTDLQRGVASSPSLQSAWTKYGADAFVFEVLEECSRELLEEREDAHMRGGCAYNHVQPFPLLTVDLTSPEITPLVQKLDGALKQLNPEELAAYAAELDAEIRAEEEAEATDEARIDTAANHCDALVYRCAHETIGESEIIELLRSLGDQEAYMALHVAHALSKAGQSETAERLLLAICDVEERNSMREGCGVAPATYEQLAIIRPQLQAAWLAAAPASHAPPREFQMSRPVAHESYQTELGPPLASRAARQHLKAVRDRVGDSDDAG
jgi:hypothetical protein